MAVPNVRKQGWSTDDNKYNRHHIHTHVQITLVNTAMSLSRGAAEDVYVM